MLWSHVQDLHAEQHTRKLKAAGGKGKKINPDDYKGTGQNHVICAYRCMLVNDYEFVLFFLGLRMKNDKAIVTFGKNSDAFIYRSVILADQKFLRNDTLLFSPHML